MLVRDCMTRNPRLVSEETSLREAAQLMRDSDTGFLPVGDSDRLQGVVTDRNIVVRGLAEGAEPNRTVGEVMTRDVLYCFEDRDVVEAAHMLGELKVRRLPVVDRDKNFVGVISLGDIAEGIGQSDAVQGEVSETLHRIAAA